MPVCDVDSDPHLRERSGGASAFMRAAVNKKYSGHLKLLSFSNACPLHGLMNVFLFFPPESTETINQGHVFVNIPNQCIKLSLRYVGYSHL